MESVLSAVNRSNQRGGRMLSVMDLLEAGTLSRAQLCWLLARVEAGSSWLVGARPGGAGKTTVMSALLAMLPAEERVWIANPGSGWLACAPGDCVVAYEISQGRYDGYVWGEHLRRFCALGEAGCRIVTNLHADTLAQARQQIVGENWVSEAGFQALSIFLPISLHRLLHRVQRRVHTIHYVERSQWREWVEAEAHPSDRQRQIGAFLDACLVAGLRSVAEVSQAWLEWRDRQPA